MLLCVDIGNTNIACGVYADGEWKAHWRLATNLDRTRDEYEVHTLGLLARWEIEPSSIDRVVVSSVVPALNGPFGEHLTRIFGVDPYFISPMGQKRVKIDIENPAELGSDLVANAVAGYEKVAGPCVVVDFGTALTFTAVKADGSIAGVSIAPGPTSALKGLFGNTSQLPYVQLVVPPTVIGRNSNRSIQSGLLYGYAHLVDGLVGDIARELDPENEGSGVQAIATGGNASNIVPLCQCFNFVDPWLTLDGLRLLGEAVLG